MQTKPKDSGLENELSKFEIDAVEALIALQEKSLPDRLLPLRTRLNSQATAIQNLLFKVLKTDKETKFYVIPHTMVSIQSEISIFESLIDEAISINIDLNPKTIGSIRKYLKEVMNYKNFEENEVDIAHFKDSENRNKLKSILSDIIRLVCYLKDKELE